MYVLPICVSAMAAESYMLLIIHSYKQIMQDQVAKIWGDPDLKLRAHLSEGPYSISWALSKVQGSWSAAYGIFLHF